MPKIYRLVANLHQVQEELRGELKGDQREGKEEEEEEWRKESWNIIQALTVLSIQDSEIKQTCGGVESRLEEEVGKEEPLNELEQLEQKEEEVAEEKEDVSEAQTMLCQPLSRKWAKIVKKKKEEEEASWLPGLRRKQTHRSAWWCGTATAGLGKQRGSSSVGGGGGNGDSGSFSISTNSSESSGSSDGLSGRSEGEDSSKNDERNVDDVEVDQFGYPDSPTQNWLAENADLCPLQILDNIPPHILKSEFPYIGSQGEIDKPPDISNLLQLTASVPVPDHSTTFLDIGMDSFLYPSLYEDQLITDFTGSNNNLTTFDLPTSAKGILAYKTKPISAPIDLKSLGLLMPSSNDASAPPLGLRSLVEPLPASALQGLIKVELPAGSGIKEEEEAFSPGSPDGEDSGKGKRKRSSASTDEEDDISNIPSLQMRIQIIQQRFGIPADAPLELINGGHGIKNPLALDTPVRPEPEKGPAQRSEVDPSKFLCRVCSKSFTLQRLLNRHMKCHSDVKRYLCTFCGKGFNDTFDLKRHTRTHTGVRPYKCNLCEKSFTQRCSLESHCLKVHGVAHQYDYKQRRSKMYVCEDCGHTTAEPEIHYLHLKDNHPYSPALLKFYDKRHFKFNNSNFASMLLQCST